LKKINNNRGGHMSLYFRIDEKDDYAIVNFNFDIVFDNINIFEDFIEMIKKNSKDAFIFNMEHVKSIDSLGLGKLLKLYQHMNVTNKKVVIANINNNIRYLFHITQLEMIFKVADSIEEAIRLLRE